MTNDFCWSCGNHGCGLCDPENHPIAWLYKGNDKELPSVALDHELDEEQKKNCIPLAPQKPWIGLTDEEINEVFGADIRDEQSGELRFIRAIEAKLRSKNG